MHPLCSRTEKDALNLPLSDPRGCAKNWQVTLMFFLLSPDLLFLTDNRSEVGDISSKGIHTERWKFCTPSSNSKPAALLWPLLCSDSSFQCWNSLPSDVCHTQSFYAVKAESETHLKLQTMPQQVISDSVFFFLPLHPSLHPPPPPSPSPCSPLHSVLYCIPVAGFMSWWFSCIYHLRSAYIRKKKKKQVVRHASCDFVWPVLKYIYVCVCVYIYNVKIKS